MFKDLITSEVRVKVLKSFFGSLGKPIHVRELTRLVGTEINAVRRELDRFSRVKLVEKEKVGNRVYYSIRRDYRYFNELLALYEKDYGLSGLILFQHSNLGKIKFGLISREFLLGRKTTPENIDLFLVGAVDLKELGKVVAEGEKRIKKEINYTVMGEEEFEFRKRRLDSFITKILTQSRIIFIGDEDKYCRIEN